MNAIEEQPAVEPDLPRVAWTDFASRRPALTYFSLYDELREQSAIYRGEAGTPMDFVMLTRMEDIRNAFQTPGTFSNRAVTVHDPDPPYLWIPEMLDAPQHTTWRHLLSPQFSPAEMAKLEPKVRQRCIEIIESFVAKGECDFVADFALHYPTSIFMELMGLPVEESEQFMVWEDAILHAADANDAGAGALAAMQAVMAYFSELIAERRKEPKDDLVSVAIGWTIDGEPIPEHELLAMCLLMFMAGLDTVAMQLSYSFLYLATHEADRRRIVADPGLIPNAIEEFLRVFAFVTPSRKITQDVQLAGCPVKAGQMVFLPLCSATRDPREFPDADKVIIDRKENRHIAFGVGPHRCLGSHLARRELWIALEEWHARIPDYWLPEGVDVADLTEHGGQIGLDLLPLAWRV